MGFSLVSGFWLGHLALSIVVVLVYLGVCMGLAGWVVVLAGFVICTLVVVCALWVCC